MAWRTLKAGCKRMDAQAGAECFPAAHNDLNESKSGKIDKALKGKACGGVIKTASAFYYHSTNEM